MTSRSRITEAPEFDVCGPLPTGITVLEASAGTGKTYAIAALAARYVATGTPLDQLLLVTFTRMATSELRDRIRERLTRTEQELSRVLAGAPPTNRDPVVDLLADAPEEEVAQRRNRLAQAVADFDTATIATTHGFCQEVLSGLGIAADVDPATTFVDDLSDLLEEVVDDLYVRRFHHSDTPPFYRAEAMSIAHIAVANPTVPIEPRNAAPSSVPAMRFRLANAVRQELEARKRRMGVMSFDDLLTRLSSVVTRDGAESAVERVRRRYRVVLVDEFQDTDPLQWEIVERVFGGGGVTLILVADPKQAIYAFRGADVYAYLRAAKAARSRATLRVNWRSDQGLIDAYDALFDRAKLGDEGIVYRSVRAADENVESRLTGAPVTTPLRIRIARRTEQSIGTTPKGYAKKDSAEEYIARDLAVDLAAVLASPADIAVRDAGGERRERVRPGHVAVLVRVHRLAALVREALDAVGIPAVINGAGSVFGTLAAREWLRLLEAIERPTSSLRAHAVALTSFLGWSAEQVATASEHEWETIHERLHQWAAVLRARGVASLTETVDLMEKLPARVLAETDGERHLTDLRHIGQLLHGAAVSERMGVAALVGWMERRIEEASTDTGDEERSRRLESDAQAVQILTIHRSKGLEFPIVYCPYLWQPSWLPERIPVYFHDTDADNARTIDVGLDGPAYRQHYRQRLVEERGEDLRLAYVALTRAQHQAVIWWAGTWDSRNSPLTRLLFGRDTDGNVAPSLDSPPTDAEAEKRFIELAKATPGSISIEASKFGPASDWTPETEAPGSLSAAPFDREIDRVWRRTSYSDITAGAYEARVASEPEDTPLSDEPSEPSLAAAVDGAANPDLLASASLFNRIPVSLHVGTFVHRVLEETDFAARDLDEELRAQVARHLGRRDVEIGEPGELIAGLRAAIETPLGRLVDGLRLCDVAWPDRLQEAEFELPLVGGDRPAGCLMLEAIADLLLEELEPEDPFRGYAARLRDPALRSSVRGFLAGTIDLVVRAPDVGGAPRFAIVDYKTNWLAGPDDDLTAWHYRPAALADEMARSHYPLQALLYAVALHRYLRWRVPSYDPDDHFAGVLYLFVRGMNGAETPTVDGEPCGVFSWRPPSGFLSKLSDLLDEGQPR